jgi:hypothetical protein
LESSDALRRGARNLDENGAIVVVDADGVVGGLDGQCASGVDHSGLDTLPGDGERTAAADPAFDARCLGRWDGWWAGGSGIADPVEFGWGERVGQAA